MILLIFTSKTGDFKVNLLETQGNSSCTQFFSLLIYGDSISKPLGFFHHHTFTHGNLMVNNDSWDLPFQGDDGYPMITRITGISHLDKLEVFQAMNLGISEQPGIPNHLRPSLGYWTSIAVRINYFHSMPGYHECRPGLTFMMTFMGLKNRCTTIDPN